MAEQMEQQSKEIAALKDKLEPLIKKKMKKWNPNEENV